MSTKVLNGLDMQSTRIENLAAPAGDNDAVRNIDLQNAIEGLNWKDEAIVATQANLNLASPGAAIDGVTLSAGSRVLVRNQTAPAENGIYIWNGAASAMTRTADASTAAELRQATLYVNGGSDAGIKYRQSATVTTLGTDSVTFVNDNSAAPAASETTSGIAEIATQSETDAGTDDLRIVTPAKLANYSGLGKRYAANIGDGSATQFDVTHNFNSRDVIVEIFRNSGAYDTVGVDISRPDANTVRINFAVAPSASAYRVIIKY